MRFFYFSLLSIPAFIFSADAKLQFFESKVRPILAEKCYECHSARSGKTKGGLRLDHIDLILEDSE